MTNSWRAEQSASVTFQPYLPHFGKQHTPINNIYFIQFYFSKLVVQHSKPLKEVTFTVPCKQMCSGQSQNRPLCLSVLLRKLLERLKDKSDLNVIHRDEPLVREEVSLLNETGTRTNCFIYLFLSVTSLFLLCPSS